jgi:hypothetical protein
MAEPLPARIDRAALERILQRAAELQMAEREIGEGLTEDELLALGREVGIPAPYLRQAMLEEGSRPLAARGAWDRVAGPGEVAARRVVRGEPTAVERALLRWFETNELLRVQRQQPGRITWEPIGGIQAAIRRSTAAAGGGRRPFMLARADLVRAAIVPLEEGTCHVALSASVRRARGAHLGSGSVLAAAGASGTALLAVLGAALPIALIPVPIGLALGYGAVRRIAPVAARTQLGLERALDHLEQAGGGALPPRSARSPGLLGLLAEEVRRAIEP